MLGWQLIKTCLIYIRTFGQSISKARGVQGKVLMTSREKC
uniref:Uncharacterized protein n=1 Tax=Rhizophora mucronata TaxID=61149 RepID=A0A2P2N7U7_RHIMU